MKKMVILLGLLLLAGTADARSKSVVRIDPTQLMAGDYITRISETAITDDTKPWFVKDLSRTAVALGEAVDTTATAVTFSFDLPNNYKGGGELYALVKPAATAFTFTLRADVQVQGGKVTGDRSGVRANATTVTAVTEGLETVALAADRLDNLSFVPLSNTAITNSLAPNQTLSVYLQRKTGTAEDVYVHAVYFLYNPKIFSFR